MPKAADTEIQRPATRQTKHLSSFAACNHIVHMSISHYLNSILFKKRWEQAEAVVAAYVQVGAQSASVTCVAGHVHVHT